MGIRKRFTAAMALAGLAVLTVTLASCGRGSGEGGTPPPATPTSSAITSHFSRQIEPVEFQQQIPAPPGVRRVEIEIDPTSLPGPVGLRALEVEIEEPEEIADEEEIESRIVDISFDPVAKTGTITLELGNQVDFSAADTEFEDDRGSRKLTFDQFVERAQAALSATPPQFLPVEAERPPRRAADGTIVAQAPANPEFFATELKLEDEDDVEEPEIEINVDADNLDISQCTPVLTQGIKVLGLCINISGAELQDEIEAEEVKDLPVDAVVEFEDHVVAVNATMGTFTLASGFLVRVPPGMPIDPAGDLFNLADVASNVAAGMQVRAEGNATIAQVQPSVVLDATDVKFQVDQ